MAIAEHMKNLVQRLESVIGERIKPERYAFYLHPDMERRLRKELSELPHTVTGMEGQGQQLLELYGIPVYVRWDAPPQQVQLTQHRPTTIDEHRSKDDDQS